MTETAARSLLETWMAAQNAGDFERYRGLYADPFRGTKRAGRNVRQFDREGWLEDRRRMFERPMRVDVSDVSVNVTPRAAIVHFTQAWSSPTFSDQGPKRLVLVPSEGGLRIASETMLQSTVERRGQEPAIDERDFRFVVRTRHTYVVVSSEGHDGWGEGPPELDADAASEISAARRPVRSEAAPAAAQAVRSKEFDLYGPSGRVCRARTADLYLLRRVVAHFGARQYWTGSDAVEGEPQQPVPAAQVARDIWAETGKTLLVAELTEVEGSCASALWGREAARPGPIVLSPETLATTEKTAARLRDAVVRLPAYRQIATEYRTLRASDGGDQYTAEHWEYFDGVAPRLRSWRGGERHLLSFEAVVGGCGDFGGALWAVFEQRAGRLVLLAHGGNWQAAIRIDAVFDANRDGLIEVLGSTDPMRPGTADAMLSGSPPNSQVVREVTPPFHDCGC